MSRSESPPVFISYSSKDGKVAAAVSEAFDKAGIAYWLAPQEILEGAEWPETITKAIDGCRVVVLLLSRHSNESPEVAREIMAALRRNIPVIPFCIEDVSPSPALDYALSTAHRLNAFEPPLEDHLIDLVRAVRRHLSDDGLPATRLSPTQSLRPIARAVAANVILFTVAGFLLLRFDLLGATDLTERYSQDIVNQVFASHYPTAAQDKLSAVLITDEALEFLEESWPASYGFHAQVLTTLLAQRPRAVMIDLLFRDRRRDDTLPQLERALQRYQAAQIPVYVAAGSAKANAVRPEIAAYVVPVPVPKQADRYDRAHREYPLVLPAYGDSVETAALRIYTDLESKGSRTAAELEQEFGRPMQILWGAVPPARQNEWIACNPPPPNARTAAWRRVFGGPDSVQTNCYYAPTLIVDHLFTQSSDPRIEELIRNRVVFYGASLLGIDDFVYPPTHTRLPGVFMHAMALDNLWTFGSGYMRRPEPGSQLSRWQSLLEAIVLGFYGAVLGLRDGVREKLRMRAGRTRSIVDSDVGVVALLTIVSLGIGLTVSLLISQWAFEALRLAPINWVGCLAAAVAVMLAKDWAIRFGHRSRLVKG
jgi:CHASE2 domain-containing sensor protein